MKEICFFTDGSSLNNQKKGQRRGGVGVFFGDKDPRNISRSLVESKHFKVTNQVAELLACVNGIERLLSSQKILGKQIVIYTDSMYIVNMMSDWASTWSRNEWRKNDGGPIKNLSIVKKLYYYTINIGIIFRHVKSHKNEPAKDDPNYFKWYGNMQADKLAVQASKKINYSKKK